MADVIKSRGVLQLVAEFTDGDDRTITLDNPKTSLTASAINSASAYAKANNLIVGDKASAGFTRFKSAKKVATTTRYLDLTD